MIENQGPTTQPLEASGIPNGLVIAQQFTPEVVATPEITIDFLSEETMLYLLEVLCTPTNVLTREEYGKSIDQRQEAVDKFLLPGGAEALNKFFGRIRNLEKKKALRVDLSMLQFSGKHMPKLYLPVANLSRLILTGSDINASNLTGANFTEGIALGTIMRGLQATGSNWTGAILNDADLSGSNFAGAKFVNTQMQGVIVDRETNFTGALFDAAVLGNTDIGEANLNGALFRGAR